MANLKRAVKVNCIKLLSLSIVYVMSSSVFAASACFPEVQNTNLPGVFDGDVAWADYDGDGDLDVAIVGRNDSRDNESLTALYLNDGSGSFTEDTSNSFPQLGHDSTVEWADYDGDGDSDLIFSGHYWIEGSGLSVRTHLYTNDGNGGFTLNGTLGGDHEYSDVIQPGFTNSILKWVDVDLDGDLDLFVTGFDDIFGRNQSSKIYLNVSGFLYEDSSFSLPSARGVALDWGDYDGDGDLDLVFSGALKSNDDYFTNVYENDGAGNFTEDASLSLIGVHRGSIKWIDYDVDGDLDLFVSGLTDDGSHDTFSVYKNDGSGGLTKDLSPVLNLDPSSSFFDSTILPADYDLDGDMDFYFADAAGDRANGIYRNNGNGGFTKLAGTSLIPVNDREGSAWGDYDGDGDQDLLITHYYYGSNAESYGYALTKLYENICVQGIQFPTLEDVAYTAGGTFSVGASSDSELAVTFVSETPEVCSVSGATATMLATGACRITASQAGNSVFREAQSVTRTMQIIPDTDNDGIANNVDTDDDNDGMPDTWELDNVFDPLDASDASSDFDDDNVTNLNEYRAATNPTLVDSDGDGINDDIDRAEGKSLWGYACNVVNDPNSSSRRWGINQYNVATPLAEPVAVYSMPQNRKIQSVACDVSGENIMFTMKDSVRGDYEVYELDVATSDLTQITDNSTDDVDLTRSRDGRTVAWQKRLDDNRQAIELRRTADKGSFVYKTLASASPFVQPSLSANGDWLAFVQLRKSFFAVMRYDITNNKYVEATSIARRKKLYHPSVSDDGNLVGWSERVSQRRYRVKNMAEGTITDIVNNPDGVEHAVLSGDGAYVMYSVNTSVDAEIKLTSLDTSETISLSDTLINPQRYLATNWSGMSASDGFVESQVAGKELTSLSQSFMMSLAADGSGSRYTVGGSDETTINWSIVNGVLVITDSNGKTESARLLGVSGNQYTVSMVVSDEAGGVTRLNDTLYVE